MLLFSIFLISLPQILIGEVMVQFQVRRYLLMSSLIPNGKICGFRGELDVNSPPKCLFQFLFVLTMEDGQVYQNETEFIELEHRDEMPDELGEYWNRSYTMKLPSKPLSIGIFVVHSGQVYSTLNGRMENYDGVKNNETFFYSLMDVLPSTSAGQTVMNDEINEEVYSGPVILLSYSMTCLGQLIGKSCDLNCTKSQIDSNVAQCKSVKTGYLSICRYTPDGQVNQCQRCPWGVKNGTYCREIPEWALNMQTKRWKPLTWVFMGLSVTLAGLLGYVVFYRGVNKKKNMGNPN